MSSTTTAVSKYAVPPFSRDRNIETHAYKNNEAPCAICKRPVAWMKNGIIDYPHLAIVVGGGRSWGDESSPEDGGHMGLWPVGRDCHRRFVVRS